MLIKNIILIKFNVIFQKILAWENSSDFRKKCEHPKKDSDLAENHLIRFVISENPIVEVSISPWNKNVGFFTFYPRRNYHRCLFFLRDDCAEPIALKDQDKPHSNKN
jgi:hypothetical protein